MNRALVYAIVLAVMVCKTSSMTHAMERLDYLNLCYDVRGVTPVTLPAPGFRMPAGAFIPLSEVGFTQDNSYRNCVDKLMVPARFRKGIY